MPLSVVLDSNMLVYVAQKRIDLFAEIERLLLGRVRFIILRQVVDELQRLTSNQSKTGREASLALKIIRKHKVTEVSTQKGETTDSLILRFASDTGSIVATGDSQLRRLARNANIPLIYLKGGTRLALEGLEPAYH